MGFFDRFAAKKPDASASGELAASSAPTSAPAGAVKPRLAAARERLEAKDLPGAMAIYEEILAGGAGDRADVLVALSGDLGMHGHVAEIIELVAPRYAADRHGPATGLNLLQAYLAVGNADSAQHVLDILFALNRPELENRLHGFSNAIAELLARPEVAPAGAAPGASGGPGEASRIGLVSISKPIWCYGLEAMAAQLLPPKEGRLRRIAFAQLALPGRIPNPFVPEAEPKPDDELSRLARAFPLWLAESFFFSPSYQPGAAVGLLTPASGESRLVDFGAEWSLENLRQLVETTEGGLDYIVSGALRATSGDYEVLLRVWEVKTFRERKTFSARWTPATADSALAQLHAEVRAYMEWSPASAALAYTIPAQPRGWLDTLGVSLGLFLVEKKILKLAQVGPVVADVRAAGERAAAGEIASLAFLALRARARRVGALAEGEASDAALARSVLVTRAAGELDR
ncbi:MAG: hypothetical protein Q8N18_07665 [Opitutaceae bacterium]|nr:hypothetical protein [Opitutaceae bacterium]